MKTLLTTLFLVLYSILQAQTPDLPAHFYVKQWHDIDSFLRTGENAKADALLVALHERAKKEKNTAQIVKTLLFKVVQAPNTSSEKENTEGYANALNALQQAADDADFPESRFFNLCWVKFILHI